MSQEEKEQHVEQGYEKLKENISGELVEKIKQFVSERDAVQNKSETEIPSVILPAESDKNKRSAVHQIINNHFMNLLVSDTVQGQIRIRHYFTVRQSDKMKTQQTFDPRNAKMQWPKDRPNYLQFLLYKENIETLNAINIVADALRVNVKNFTWAGTKDKRAITVQRVTGYRIDAERLVHINNIKNRKLGNGQVQVGNYEYVEEPLKLGHLGGNHFKLVLRDLHAIDSSGTRVEKTIEELQEIVKKSVASLEQYGFINYFGMQRFGMNSSAPTSTLGKFLLNRQYEQIAISMLSSRKGKGDKDPIKAALDYFLETGDTQGAINKLPRFAAIEKTILKGYKDDVKNHIGAVQALPLNLKSMFIHAYQSYVWNHMVTERIKKYGIVPMVGDLVYAEQGNDVPIEDEEEAEQQQHGRPVVALTEQDLEKYTIYDIVFPVVGCDIQFPKNEFNKERFEEFMLQDGITLQHFADCHEYVAYGTYRNIMARPRDVEWSIKKYQEQTTQITPSDMDVLRKTEIVVPEGDKLALVVEFTLNASTYATMCLRELMKVPSTSLANKE